MHVCDIIGGQLYLYIGIPRVVACKKGVLRGVGGGSSLDVLQYSYIGIYIIYLYLGSGYKHSVVRSVCRSLR